MNDVLTLGLLVPGVGILTMVLILFVSHFLEQQLSPRLLALERPRRLGPRYDPALVSAILARQSLPVQEPSDRRSSPRRIGQEVAVLIAGAGDGQAPTQGSVVDRSRGGLRLALPRPVPAGTLLHLLAPEAPEGVSWVPVEVRHGRQEEGRWLAGCRFAEALPWAVLLLFG